jgi:hypothetical protein
MDNSPFETEQNWSERLEQTKYADSWTHGFAHWLKPNELALVRFSGLLWNSLDNREELLATKLLES